MGVDIGTYRIRIGCCGHIYGSDVIRETVTVNVAMVSKTVCLLLFLLLIASGLLSYLPYSLESAANIHLTSSVKEAVSVVCSIHFLCRQKDDISDLLIWVVIFIRLLLQVQPNPGMEYRILESLSNSDEKHHHFALCMVLLSVGIELLLFSLLKQMNKEGYKESHMFDEDNVDTTQDTLYSVSGLYSGTANTSMTSRTYSYLLGNKGAHMTNGNPHSKGDVTFKPKTTSIIEQGVHCSIGFIHLDKLNEEEDSWSEEEDGFNSHGTGFCVGDCYMMTAYHVLRDRIESFIENITFEVSFVQKIERADLLSKLKVKDQKCVDSPRDIFKTFLKENAVDIPLLLSCLDVSENFKAKETALWNKHCVVDFLDKGNNSTFTIDWRIPFGSEENDVLIVKLLKTTPSQAMPPRLYLAETYEQMKNMFIVRFINKSKPEIVLDQECNVFTKDEELEKAVKSSMEWWTSIFGDCNTNSYEGCTSISDKDDIIDYEGCTKAYNTDTGRVILRAAESFIFGSSGSPIVYLDEKEFEGLIFVGMIYQRGFPIVYYKREKFWKGKIQEKTGKLVNEEVLFEGCTTLQKVAELLTKSNKLELKDNIFNTKHIYRRLNENQVMADLRNKDHDPLFEEIQKSQGTRKCTINDILHIADFQPTESMKRVVEKWSGEETLFVETKTTRFIGDKLKDSNILTIVGSAGSGKSSAMHHAALLLQKQGFSLFVIEHCSEVKKYIQKGQKSQLFLIDDPIGEDEIDHQKLQEWQASSTYIKACMTGSTKLVATIRKEITKRIGEFPGLIFNTEHIDLHSKSLSMNADERFDYFTQILRKKNIETDISSVSEMILACELHNFPLLVHMYCTDDYFRDHPSELFKELLGVFESRIERMWQFDKKQFGSLLLCCVNQDKLKVETFDPFMDETTQMQTCKQLLNALNISDDLRAIGEELNKLEGIYISKTSEYYTFKHSEFKYVVTYIVGKKYSSFLLKYFDTSFCLKRCQLSRKSCNIYVLLSNRSHVEAQHDKYKITIEKEDEERRIAAAFIKTIAENEDFGTDIFVSSFCQDKKFLHTMYEEVKKADIDDDKKIKVLHQILCNACLYDFEDFIEELTSETIEYKSGSFTGLTPLAGCTYAGNTTHMEMFIAHGCDVDLEYKGYTPLGLAALNKNAIAVEILLSHACDVNLGFHTPLSVSASNCDEQTVKILLDHGADINTLDGNGLSPLAHAVCIDISLSELLLKRYADVNKCGDKDNSLTPLSAASTKGQENTVRLLLENNADVNKIDGSGNTALTNSIVNEFESIAHLLLQYNADVNAASKQSHATTPLCAAACKGLIDTLTQLLQSHANVNMYCGKGLTPLSWAIYKRKFNVVDCLLEHMANVNICGDAHSASTPLTSASDTGLLDLVTRLLDKGADINKCDGLGNTPLTQAILKNNVDVINFLLEKKADVNSCGRWFQARTPLTAACDIGLKDIVTLLLEKGADVDKYDGGNNTPLSVASDTRSMAIVKDLLDKGADVNKYDGEGNTPLTLAILKNNVDLIKVLLENQADVNKHGYQDGAKTPLTAASDTGSMETLDYILRKGADINKCDKIGNTPLTQAILKNNDDLMNVLLENKADVNMCGKSFNARTPLTAAIDAGSNAIVRRLLKKGADVNEVDRLGKTHLTKAILKNNARLINILLENKADINKCGKGYEAKIPLMAAIDIESRDIVKRLLDKGAAVNVFHYDMSGSRREITPLVAAINKGSIEIAKLLLDKGANVNKSNINTNTPLTHAVLKNKINFINILLENKADVNKCGLSLKTETPLIAAVAAGSIEVVKRLLEKGADINKSNRKGYIPLTRAILMKNENLINVLLKNKAGVNVCGKGPEGKTPLVAASETGSVDLVKRLLNEGADINMKDCRGNTPLTRAILTNSVDVINVLLENKADVNMCGDHVFGKTPLAAAVDKYRKDIVQLLLDKGANINKYNGDGITPLTQAILENNIDVINILLENKADVNICGDGDKGKTPLTAASHTESRDLVKLLLDKGADINKYDGAGITPLTRAILKNNIDIINLFLENKADVNSGGDSDKMETPLTAAINTGSRDLVNLLLDKGSNINKYNGNGNTPITLALLTDNVDVVDLLLSDNADVNICGNGIKAKTPLTAASLTESLNKHVVIRILDKGAEVNKCDGRGYTPLTQAIFRKNLDLVNIFLENNADVNICGDGNTAKTPLTAGSYTGAMDVVKRLLDEGADVNKHDGEGNTPLTQAILKNNDDVINVLLENKADVNMRDDSATANTPLTASVENGSLDIVKSLMDKGADVNICDGEGNMPLTQAILRENVDFINLLLENQADVNICGYTDKAETPLTAASYTGSTDVVKLLLDKGADINKYNQKGNTPLTKSILKQKVVVINFLLEQKADVNTCGVGNESNTPLTAAINTWSVLNKGSESIKLVNRLLNEGADVNRYSGDGNSPLTLAILKKNVDGTNLLLENKADVNICGVNDKAKTPLTAASSRGARNTVELLLDKGASINKCDGTGNTPLTVAVLKNHVDIFNVLLEKKADVNMCGDGDEAKTPLMAAMDTGSKYIVNRLLDLEVDVNKYERRMSTPLVVLCIVVLILGIIISFGHYKW